MNSEMQENRMNDHDDLSIYERPTAKLPDLPVSDEQAEQAKGGLRVNIRWERLRVPFA